VNYIDSTSTGNYKNEHNLDNITFNLIMKEKKGQVLYNINYDPDLSYFKKYYLNDNNDILNPNNVINNQNKLNMINSNKNNSSKKYFPNFNFIPLEKADEFSFSRIFTTNKTNIIQRLKILQVDLEENLRDELDTEQDERRIQSLTKCIELMKLDIDYYENISKKTENTNDKRENKNTKSDSNKKLISDTNIRKSNQDNSIIANIDNLNLSNNNNNNNEEKRNSLNQGIENLSTVDEDSQNLNRNNYSSEFGSNVNIDLKNYFFFYQESKGDIYLLHPINYQILLKEYEIEDHLPTNISVF